MDQFLKAYRSKIMIRSAGHGNETKGQRISLNNRKKVGWVGLGGLAELMKADSYRIINKGWKNGRKKKKGKVNEWTDQQKKRICLEVWNTRRKEVGEVGWGMGVGE